jgi:hypothetical protein
MIQLCPAQLRKNGATQLDPQHCWMFPPACTKSWLCAISYTIRVGLNETFIVIETVIDRYLAVET